MHFHTLSPPQQIVTTMKWIYEGGMTTSTGGNISLKEPGGDIWVTPSGMDKGIVGADDIVHLDPDAKVISEGNPSSELPSHYCIYRERPDIGAVIHAHPPGLITFSIAGEIPDTNIISRMREVCGNVGFAPYRIPGSEALGRSIAGQFARGHQAVVMENHGVAVGGKDLDEAYRRFELLEACCQTIIHANRIGNWRGLSIEEIEKRRLQTRSMPSGDHTPDHSEQLDLRSAVTEIAKRVCRQRLMTSSGGCLSVRTGVESCWITPENINKRLLEPEELVLLRQGQSEKGKVPDRLATLHQQIYLQHPGVRTVITARPPCLSALGITGRTLDTRTIPESYVFLRDIPLVSCSRELNDPEEAGRLSGMISYETPMLLIRNELLLVTGRTLQEAFDRLEIAEFGARSAIDALVMGGANPLHETQLRGLEKFIS
ncbi:class II aldolase/adducin family protein [Halalkalibaculum sp. DA384]|uniref:class II aldolase/adducin family protein n=1 Tax=Halalkalibaculum sp. DA384 TaxID=3373606 RepID=UPI003754BB10